MSRSSWRSTSPNAFPYHTVTVNDDYTCPSSNVRQNHIYVFPHLVQPVKGSKVQGDVIDNVYSWQECGEFFYYYGQGCGGYFICASISRLYPCKSLSQSLEFKIDLKCISWLSSFKAYESLNMWSCDLVIISLHYDARREIKEIKSFLIQNVVTFSNLIKKHSNLF